MFFNILHKTILLKDYRSNFLNLAKNNIEKLYQTFVILLCVIFISLMRDKFLILRA